MSDTMVGMSERRRWSDRALCTAFRASKPMLKLVRAVMPKVKEEEKWKPPEKMEKRKPTSQAEWEASLDTLAANKSMWSKKEDQEKAILLQTCMNNIVQVMEEAAAIGHRAKGQYEMGLAEEMFAWVTCILFAKETIQFLLEGDNCLHGVTSRQVGNQVVCTVLPTGLDCMLYAEYRGEVWLEPGQPPTVGQKAKAVQEREELALILGAGNQIPVIFGDVIHKLFVESSVAMLKFSPVNCYNGTVLEKVFEPLLNLGILKFAYGGSDVGEALVGHKKVDAIHLTGSEDTFNAIVWGGTPDEGAEGTRAVNKRITAELGGCTPYIIFPGEWTNEQLDYMARQIVAGKVHNSGHNCLAAEVVVTSRTWRQREQFLNRLEHHFNTTAQRVPYYPGSFEKYKAFKRAAARANLKELGKVGVEGAVPWILVENLDPKDVDGTEHWCGVMQEVALDLPDDDLNDFARSAVEFANERCAGQLSCSVWASQEVQTKLGAAWEKDVILGLRYGSISVNTCILPAFGFSRLGWGAYPGNGLDNIGSGNAMIHNSLRFDHLQKSVLYCPLPVFPPAIWLHDIKNGENIARLAAKYFANPSIGALAKLAVANLRA